MGQEGTWKGKNSPARIRGNRGGPDGGDMKAATQHVLARTNGCGLGADHQRHNGAGSGVFRD